MLLRCVFFGNYQVKVQNMLSLTNHLMYISMYMFTIFSVLNLCSVDVQAQSVEHDRFSTQLTGTDFWFAIPPLLNQDEIGYASVSVTVVAPKRPEKVVLEIPSIGYKESFDVSGTMFDVDELVELQVFESETIQNKAVHVHSESPITLRVYSGALYAGSTFLIHPVTTLGTSYRHIGFFDNVDTAKNRNYSGGFIVVATEDNTDIEMTLNGKGLGLTA